MNTLTSFVKNYKSSEFDGGSIATSDAEKVADELVKIMINETDGRMLQSVANEVIQHE